MCIPYGIHTHTHTHMNCMLKPPASQQAGHFETGLNFVTTVCSKKYMNIQCSTYIQANTWTPPPLTVGWSMQGPFAGVLAADSNSRVRDCVWPFHLQAWLCFGRRCRHCSHLELTWDIKSQMQDTSQACQELPEWENYSHTWSWACLLECELHGAKQSCPDWSLREPGLSPRVPWQGGTFNRMKLKPLQTLQECLNKQEHSCTWSWNHCRLSKSALTWKIIHVQVHAEGKALDRSNDDALLKSVAETAVGYSGAELTNLLNEAAIQMVTLSSAPLLGVAVSVIQGPVIEVLYLCNTAVYSIPDVQGPDKKVLFLQHYCVFCCLLLKALSWPHSVPK